MGTETRNKSLHTWTTYFDQNLKAVQWKMLVLSTNGSRTIKYPNKISFDPYLAPCIIP